MLKKSAIIVLLLSLITPFMSGCWSRNEIETLAIVTGMGIDIVKQDNQQKFQLSLTIVRPSLAGGGPEGGGSKGQPVFWRVTSIGRTLAEAERNMNLRIPRRIFYGHLRFVLVSEMSASQGLTDIFDYLHRNLKIRPRLLVLLCESDTASKLLSYPELESTLSEQVEGIDRLVINRISKVKIIDLAETTDQMVTPGRDPVIAKLITTEIPPAEPGGKPLQTIRFYGAGVIKVDNLVGWLTPNEFRGYLMATGEARQGAFSLKLKPHYTDDVSINMTQTSGKIKVKAKGDEIVANIDIRAEGDLAEYHNIDEIATNEGVKKLNAKFREAIEKEVKSALTKSKQLNADIFGFGSALHRSDPESWHKLEKRWYKMLPKIKINLKVEAHIRRTGMIADPYVPQ